MAVDPKHAYPLSAATKRPPSWQYPLGTDFFGRDLLAAMVVGMWQTAAIGVLAGGIGTLIGVVLGFISAYFGGWLDIAIRSVCQVLTPIPVLLLQVVIALAPSKMTLTLDGKSPRTTWARGDVQFIGRGVAHESQNMSGKPIDYVIIAIK